MSGKRSTIGVAIAAAAVGVVGVGVPIAGAHSVDNDCPGEFPCHRLSRKPQPS